MLERCAAARDFGVVLADDDQSCHVREIRAAVILAEVVVGARRGEGPGEHIPRVLVTRLERPVIRADRVHIVAGVGLGDRRAGYDVQLRRRIRGGLLCDRRVVLRLHDTDRQRQQRS